jgi:glycosyltransferase involved in cell wall biosynthesis
VSYRVLHVTSSFPRHPDDAVAPFLLDLARGQTVDGMRVTVIAPHDEGLPRREQIDGVEIVRVRYAPARYEQLAYRGGLLRAVRDVRRLPFVPGLVASLANGTRKVAQESRPDVIHAHWWLPSGLAALAARPRTLVVTLHGSDVGLLAKPGVAPVGRMVASRARFVAAVSDALLEEARGPLRLDATRSGVVPMPIVVDAPAAARPIPAGPPWRAIAIGRASPEKGFDVLLEALARARAAGADVRLELVGSGPERGPLVAQSERLGLGDAVTFVDPIARAALHARVLAAHAVVVPSRREGLGLVAVEALALGRPVIASRTGGLPEVVTPGAGVLVTPDDPEALAAALRALPLPAPPDPAPAVARHDLSTVIAAHREMYARAIATS